MTSGYVRDAINVSRKRMDVASLDMLQFHWHESFLLSSPCMCISNENCALIFCQSFCIRGSCNEFRCYSTLILNNLSSIEQVGLFQSWLP